MYTLYYLPDACSLAVQVILNELHQEVEIIHRDQVPDFTDINPVGAVPVLKDNGVSYNEGASVILYLLQKHNSDLFPVGDKDAEQRAIQDIMFANATMHPAYGRLFFAAQHVSDEQAQQQVLDASASVINHLWQVVESRLRDRRYLGGASVSAADIMLAVYFRWGAGFPVVIKVGERTRQMIDYVLNMPSFKLALSRQSIATEAFNAERGALEMGV